MNDAKFEIRTVTRQDVPTIFRFIRENAEVIGESNQLSGSWEQLEKEVFGPAPSVEGVFATLNGNPIGQVLFYTTFSSYLCKAGLYLEEVYVSPEFRGNGYGQKLLSRVAAIAKDRGCCRIEWSVNVDSDRAKKFYSMLGAEEKASWRIFRLGLEEIERLVLADAV